MLKIWLINLDRDQTRLRWMRGQLNAMHAPFERFSALTPEGLTDAQRRYASAPQRAQMRPAEIACLLSHIEVWRAIADGSDDAALILEDDVHLSPDFPAFWKTLTIDPNEVSIHRLETFLARVTLARAPAFEAHARRAHKLLTNHAGGAAYVINKVTARTLLSLIDQFQNNVDVELFDPERGAASALTTYQWIPALCIQDQRMGRGAKGFASNIPERADIDSGLYEDNRREPLKDRLRPIYTLAYDLALAPFGRARRFVPYR